MQFGLAGLAVTTFASSPIVEALRTLRTTRGDDSERMTRRLEALLEAGETEATDLVDAVPLHHREWVAPLQATVTALLAEGRDVRLLECSYDAATDAVAVSIIESSRRHLVAGDEPIAAGCAVTADADAVPRVVPRLWRQACANGLVVDDALWAADASAAPGVGAAARRALEISTVKRIGGRLNATADVRVDDPALALIEARIRSDPRPIVREFRRARDASGWGLINAVTSQARRVRPFAARLDHEADACRLLPVLERWGLAQRVEALPPEEEFGAAEP